MTDNRPTHLITLAPTLWTRKSPALLDDLIR